MDAATTLSALAGAVLAVVAERSLAALRRRWRARRRARRALVGERRAERLLARRGYRVVERQPPRSYSLTVDGEPHRVEVRADLLVSRRGRLFVAEVKTGKVAPDVGTASTRRQLLEYRVAYDAAGILLVDMERETVCEVLFPERPRSLRLGAILQAAALIAAGALVGAWVGLLFSP